LQYNTLFKKMSPPRNWIIPTITVKLVYTQCVYTYQVDPNWKLNDFWNILKSRLMRDFEIEEFELVEAGQNMSNGIAEEGLAFNKNENIRLREKYGPTINVSFYIRPIRRESPQQSRVEECIICYENTNNYSNRYRYRCNHPICSTCIRECNQHSIDCCPMCRGR